MAYRCVEGHDWCNGCSGGEPCGAFSQEIDLLGQCEACGEPILSREPYFDFEGEYVHDAAECLRTYWQPCLRPSA